MTRQRRDKGSSTPVSDSRRDSTHNPRAPARRRLLRALGKSGGVALGTVLAAGWRKPVVRAVLLPAHAQTSPPENPPPPPPAGCVVVLEAGYKGRTDGAPYSGSLLLDGSLLTSGSGTTDTGLPPVSTTLPPGTYTFVDSISQGETENFALDVAVFCCNTTSPTTHSVVEGGATALYEFYVAIGEDGQCQVAFGNA